MRVTLLVLVFAVGCSAEVADEPGSYSVRWAERAGGTCGPVDDTETTRFPMPVTDCLGTADAAECDVQGRTLSGSLRCDGLRCVLDSSRSPGCSAIYDLTFTPR